MNVLYNFKDLKLKGVPYEDLNMSQIELLLGNYFALMENSVKYNVDKDNLKKHFDYMLSLYQGNIISILNSLSKDFKIDYSTNFLVFDAFFKKREKNIEKKSFLIYLCEVECIQDLRYQFGLAKTISNMVEKIKSTNTLKEAYLQMATKLFPSAS